MHGTYHALILPMKWPVYVPLPTQVNIKRDEFERLVETMGFGDEALAGRVYELVQAHVAEMERRKQDEAARAIQAVVAARRRKILGGADSGADSGTRTLAGGSEEPRRSKAEHQQYRSKVLLGGGGHGVRSTRGLISAAVASVSADLDSKLESAPRLERVDAYELLTALLALSDRTRKLLRHWVRSSSGTVWEARSDAYQQRLRLLTLRPCEIAGSELLLGLLADRKDRESRAKKKASSSTTSAASQAVAQLFGGADC